MSYGIRLLEDWQEAERQAEREARAFGFDASVLREQVEDCEIVSFF